MKKIFLIILAGWTLNIHAQSSVYHPFPVSNAAWNIYYTGSWHICDEEFAYTLSGDTIVGNLTYHKIEAPYVLRHGTCPQIHPSGYNGAFREDTSARQVFYLPPDSTIEELLYDFNLQVGDSVPGFIRFNCFTPTLAILSIDSILIGTDYRKRWLTGHAIPYHPYNYIIEGIGFQTGLLQQCPDYGTDAAFYTLSCFQHNGITLYPDTNTNCMIINSTKIEKSISNPEVYPNPFKNFLIVKSESNETYEIILYDIAMKKLQHHTFDQTVNLNTGSFAKGIYIYEIRNPEGLISRGKVIKN